MSELGWTPAVWHALPVTLFVLALFYYWFGVANRYLIFLYEHLGATPFDAFTVGRYWMAGLVASGAVLVLYAGANWLIGRMAASRRKIYCPPHWLRVWALCLPPLLIGIPLITMTLNWPTLPPTLAAASTGATLFGLALALMPGHWAARRPSDLAWLALDGIGLMPVFMLLRVVELPARGLVSEPVAFIGAPAVVIAGVIWLSATTILRLWQGKPPPGAAALYVSGLSLSYLLMPLLHLLMRGYITTSSNFFAFGIFVQLAALILAAFLAFGFTVIRRRLWR